MNFELLIVDDDPDTIFFYNLLVKISSFHPNPLTFANGQEIIDFLKNQKESTSNFLIFLDIYMGEKKGWEVMNYIKTLNKPEKIKVILISSSIDIIDKRMAMNYENIIDYVEKPLLKNYLVTLKSKVLFST